MGFDWSLFDEGAPIEDEVSMPLDDDVEPLLPLIKDEDAEVFPPQLLPLYIGLDCDNALRSFRRNFARRFWNHTCNILIFSVNNKLKRAFSGCLGVMSVLDE